MKQTEKKSYKGTLLVQNSAKTDSRTRMGLYQRSLLNETNDSISSLDD